jgi:hypothetical protein
MVAISIYLQLDFWLLVSKARITAKVRQVGLTIQFPQQVWSSCVMAAASADYRLDTLLESAKPEARKR